MRKKKLLTLFYSILLVLVLAACSRPAVSPQPAEPEVELINPEGVAVVAPVKIAPRLDTLVGKTVTLRWNGKPNGDIFLNKIAELLAAKVPTAKIIKLYEVDPTTATYTSTVEAAAAMAKVVQGYHPDIVITAQGD